MVKKYHKRKKGKTPLTVSQVHKVTNFAQNYTTLKKIDEEDDDDD